MPDQVNSDRARQVRPADVAEAELKRRQRQSAWLEDLKAIVAEHEEPHRGTLPDVSS